MNTTSTPRSTVQPRWSDQDLELYHDDELDAAASEALARDLLADATLRARLSGLTAIDRQGRQALLAAPANAPMRGLKFPGLELAVIGGTLALAAALTMMIWPAAAPAPVNPASPAPEHGTIASGSHGAESGGGSAPGASDTASNLDRAGVRVLASLEGPSKPAGAARAERSRRARSTFAAAPADKTPAEPSLQNLLDAGDVDGFLARTRQATGEDRDAAFGLLGGTLRSAMTAQRVLDGLSPEEQLSICIVWAHEPHLRPVTFERLALLQERPELRERVAMMASELSRSRELLAWVKSYRLESAPAAIPLDPRAG